MHVIRSQTQSDAADHFETPDESSVSKMTVEILPTCFLLGIISGFTAFVLFGQAIIPGVIAAVIGALAGLFFSCEKHSTQESDGLSRNRK